MLAQLPAGAMVDAARNKRPVAAFAVLAIVGSALLLALLPERAPVYAAEVLHGLASCLLTPAIAALSLAATGAGGALFGVRLGRNARFASIGSGVAAALMGATGYYVSQRSVFLLAALLAVPALFTLRLIQVDAAPVALGAPPVARPPLLGALTNRRLLLFAVCCAGFHLANAGMFPLAAVEVTRQAGSKGQLVIAACLVVPQVLVASISPWVGHLAEIWGRRPVLLAGFAAVPLRGALFAVVSDPTLVIVVQSLDGLSAAIFGVMLPLVISDITGGPGRFNLSMGAVGLAIGAGATLSTELAGLVADAYHTRAAFLALAAAGGLAFLLLLAFMPETQPGKAPR